LVERIRNNEAFQTPTPAVVAVVLAFCEAVVEAIASNPIAGLVSTILG
jgi:hypothetical protein